MFVPPEKIFSATNGGLDVILYYYPQAAESSQNQTRKFRIRENDKTKSASLKQVDGGVWVVTDFGDDQKPRNCIEITRREENCDFKRALEIIAARYNILPDEELKKLNKAEVTRREATEEEQEGEYFWDLKDTITETELRELFSKKVIDFYQHNYKDDWQRKLQQVCFDLNFRSLNSFTQIKDRKAIITSSTETYPIFLIEGGTFKKIYQPKNIDKQYRFRYTGDRPKDYIFGYQRIIKLFRDLEAKLAEENRHEDEEPEEVQLEHVMICSGDRDSLNASALGYNVIWLNSESAKLPENTMTQLRKMCKEIYNIPDIDSTGYKQGHELAMKYLDIKTIWLPETLRTHKDFRGNPCKDLRDYLNYYSKKSFDGLVKVALAYQFWNVEPQFKRNGHFHKWGYRPSNTRLYNFLMRNGFWRFKLDNEKEGYVYIQIADNVVKQIKAAEIRSFVNQFIEDRKMDEDLRDTFYRSTQLGDNSLSNLKDTEINFTDYTRDSQTIFFINKTWLINKDGIQEFRSGEISRFVWDQELIKHRVKLKGKPFTITTIMRPDGSAEFDIEIHDKECLFLKYLVNASRIYWRKEYEEGWAPNQEQDRLRYIEENKFNIAGPRLSAEEIAEQKHHLINKIYSLGYLLHRYKDPSRPWCVFAMDSKITEEGGSHGGSGKSIAYKAVRYFMNSVTLDGRNPNLTKNPHIYELVSEHTDFILIDDADEYLNFNFFFAPLTGDLTVNPKNNKQFILPFKDVPKFAISSNFTLRNMDPSTLRRILYTEFGDYYHYNKDNEYRESRNPRDDFGKNLFEDFTEEEWNSFFNTMAWSCSMYMNHEKIEPPMKNIAKRNLQTEMGIGFQPWADVYFSFESKRLDELVNKPEAFEDFKNSTGNHKWTPQRFSKSLKAWCRYYGYEFNPMDLRNPQGRITRQVIRKIYSKDNTWSEKEITTEMIYIKTTAQISKSALEKQNVATTTAPPATDENFDDLPY